MDALVTGKHRWVSAPIARLACLTILATLAAWSLGITALSPIDDHRFVDTLFAGKPFGYYVSPQEGRFFPLTAQEYVVAAMTAGPSARLFHIIATVKMVAAGLLLLHCLARTRASAWAITILWCVVVLSVGFVNAALRLQVGEINVLVLTLVFVWTCLFLEEDRATSPPTRHAIAAVGLGCMALGFLYKETAFVLALAYGSAELARHARQGRPIPRRIWGLLSTGAAYIVLYALWRDGNAAGSYVNYYSMARLHVLYLYAVTDPFIVAVAIPLAALRTWVVLRDPARHTLHDSFLIAASAYAAAYLALGIHNNYYLLPAYGFAACGVAGLLAQRVESRVMRLTVPLCALLVANTLPAAISDMAAMRSIPNNHRDFVDRLSAWIRANPMPAGSRRTLVLAGVSPSSGIEVLHSLATYLRFQGIDDASFDLRATQPSDNDALRNAYRAIEPHMSFFADEAGYRPRAGDLVVFNPYQEVRRTPPGPTPSLREVYSTGSQWTAPRWWGWHWARNCVFRPMDCGAEVSASRRYTGYSAVLVIGETLPSDAAGDGPSRPGR